MMTRFKILHATFCTRPRSPFRNLQSAICNPQSAIRNPQSLHLPIPRFAAPIDQPFSLPFKPRQ